MATGSKKQYGMEDLEQRYHQITALYDQANDLLATVESEFVKDQDAQLALIEPLIHDLGDATDVLAEEFVLVAEGVKNKGKSRASKTRIEGAMRKIYNAIHAYHGRVRGAGKRAQDVVKNIADPIVAKIQRQVEKVIVVFLEFINVSLQNLMNKTDLEALKVRDTRIAMMMHQHAMAQQS